MKKILIALIYTIYSLAALIPFKNYSQIITISNNIELNNNLGLNNMSGLVVRNINGVDYAIAYIKQISNKKAILIDKDPLNGGHLANIKPIIKIGDSVIGGFLYDKYILLAPNKKAFTQIKNSFNLEPLDSDLFLAYLKAKQKESPSSSDYKEFAKISGVGLFIIAKNNIIKLYDPISQKVIKKVSFNFDNSINIKPFYTNLN